MKSIIVLAILAILVGCAPVDRSNTFSQNIEMEGGEVTITVTVKKSGSESNESTNTPDISPSLSIPASVL